MRDSRRTIEKANHLNTIAVWNGGSHDIPAAYTEHLRILALDLGKRRIGMALSDELGFTAQGLPTLNAINKRTDLAELTRIVREKSVSLILVGYPLNMSGEAGPQAQWVTEYAATLEQYTGLTVKLWDERLTSAAASRLLRESNARPDRKSGTVDRMAAVILLQSYLDSLSVGQ